MGEEVGEYFRLPIKLVDDGKCVPWISVIDISGAQLPFNTRLPSSPEERDFLGDYGKQAELEAIKRTGRCVLESMNEAEEG
jgi:hypothetical protein